MLKILPYSKELLASFIYDGVEKEISGEQIMPIAEYYAQNGSVYVGLIEEKIIGIGGVYPLWKNTGGCFLFLNKEARKYKKSVFKILLEYMNMLIKQYQIKTLIVECLDDSLEAHRLIRHLGFLKSREIKMAFYIRNQGE